MSIRKKIAYSKPILVNNHLTIGLFDKNHKLLDIRICYYDKENNKFICPREPTIRKALAKKMGLTV